MTEQTNEAPTLTLQDLTLTANIIDLAMQRGAFKAAEAETVGAQFKRIVAIVEAITPAPEEADEAAEDAAE